MTPRVLGRVVLASAIGPPAWKLVVRGDPTGEALAGSSLTRAHRASLRRRVRSSKQEQANSRDVAGLLPEEGRWEGSLRGFASQADGLAQQSPATPAGRARAFPRPRGHSGFRGFMIPLHPVRSSVQLTLSRRAPPLAVDSGRRSTRRPRRERFGTQVGEGSSGYHRPLAKAPRRGRIPGQSCGTLSRLLMQDPRSSTRQRRCLRRVCV